MKATNLSLDILGMSTCVVLTLFPFIQNNFITFSTLVKLKSKTLLSTIYYHLLSNQLTFRLDILWEIQRERKVGKGAKDKQWLFCLMFLL